MSENQENKEENAQNLQQKYVQFEDEDEQGQDKDQAKTQNNQEQNEKLQKKAGFFGKMKQKVSNIKNQFQSKQNEKKQQKEQKTQELQIQNQSQQQLNDISRNSKENSDNLFQNQEQQLEQQNYSYNEVIEIDVSADQNININKKNKSKFKDFKQYVSEKVSNSKQQLKQNFAVQKAKAIQKFKATSAYNKYKQKRRNFSIYLKSKQEEVVLKGLAVLKKKISKKIVDPHLYKPLQNFANDVFEENWVSIVEEVQFQFRLRQMEPYLEIEDQPQNCFTRFAAWFNYQLYPNDKGIGKKLRNWRYLLLQFISVIPYGVQSFYFFIYILCMDKKDEYQLTYFIVNFKKMQFITQGICLGIYGYIDFQMCVALATRSEEPLVYQQCLQNGPGANENIKLMIVTYLMNLIFVWACCILLPFSKKKGLPKFKVLEDMKGKVITQELDDNENSQSCEKTGMHLFFSKWIYGMLSFPFIIFNIPIFLNVLTRSRPTCYDKKGNCVPPKTDVMYFQPESNYDDEYDEQIDDIFGVDDDLIDNQIEEINKENNIQQVPQSQDKKNNNQLLQV